MDKPVIFATECDIAKIKYDTTWSLDLMKLEKTCETLSCGK